MHLITALCLLFGCVAPHACRSVDARDPPNQDLEPFVARHHHEGNIAELLIPLLERSLAQSEARSNERQHRRPKPGKKVIQVLPYPGSGEHKRKSWRKLNSHKKQVVEITPLHGKNGAKPLAYILSAAKPSHVEETETNDEDSVSASDLEHDKSTSEEQQSTEEAKDSDNVNVDNVRAGAGSDAGSDATSENLSNRDSKDLSASDKEYSADVTSESVAESAEKSGTDPKVLVVEDSAESQSRKLHEVRLRNHRVTISDEDKTSTVEENVTGEDEGVTSEDVTVENLTSEDKNADVTAETQVTAENDDVTAESGVTAENRDLTAEADVTVEDRAVTAEEGAVTAENEGVTAEESETEERQASADVTSEDSVTAEEERAVTAEEERAVTAEEEQAVTAEEERAVTAEEERAVTAEEENAVTAEERSVTSELDVTVENADVTAEREALADTHTHTHAHNHHHHPHVEEDGVSNINDITDNLERAGILDNEDNSIHSRGGFIADDIVISRARHDSAEKNFGKLFDSRARDIIELIQSSVEASTARHRDCIEQEDKHSHDHKSYRLSFLFNK